MKKSTQGIVEDESIFFFIFKGTYYDEQINNDENWPFKKGIFK